MFHEMTGEVWLLVHPTALATTLMLLTFVVIPFAKIFLNIAVIAIQIPARKDKHNFKKYYPPTRAYR